MFSKTDSQIKLKNRIAKYGEVFTADREVNAMLDLVKHETQRIDSRFLEPACGTGNFLVEILRRKLVEVEKKNKLDYEHYAVLAVSSIYGIDILEDNVQECRARLLSTFNATKFKDKCAVILDNNIIRRDALTDGLFNMQFDVIIGNPPYQLNDGGGTGSSAKPIYNKFIAQAKKLNPRYLSMIIPARWYSGGKGLDKFRGEMLNDSRIRQLVDYVDSRDCFPEVDIAGGVCYFLWDRSHNGQCKIQTIHKGKTSTATRSLNEFPTFIRDNLSVDIIKKIKNNSNSFMNDIVSSRKPFGLESSIRPMQGGNLTLITSAGNGTIFFEKITNGQPLINKWKVLLSKASNDHGGRPDKEGKRKIFSRIEVMPPGTVCTESYLVIGPFESKLEAINMVAYLKTKLCRFLVSTILLTQNITKGKFIFVPNLDMHEFWTDEKLYKKYGIDDNEVAFINSMIRNSS